MFGSNQLIYEGGKCVRSAKDILEQYSIECDSEIDDNNECGIDKVPKELMEVYKVLSKRGKCLDEICAMVNMPTSKVISSLTLLVLQDFAIQYSNNFFAKK